MCLPKVLFAGTFFVTMLGWYGDVVGETRNDIWPEADVYVNLNETYRLHFLGALVQAGEGGYSDGQLGVHLDIGLRDILEPGLHPDRNRYKYLWIRMGYRYASSFSGTDSFQEHRGILEGTARLPLPYGFTLVDRNRGDLRLVNGEYSSRYRNRIRLERETHFGPMTLLPYISVEGWYDTRFNAINRFRYAAGFEIPIRTIVFDLYYLRQEDTLTNPRHSNVLGIAINFYF
jgi:hypothetical protein